MSMFGNILEASILGFYYVSPIKVGESMDGDQITKISPIFNPEGALIALKVIGSADKLLRTITVNGVPCSIKTN